MKKKAKKCYKCGSKRKKLFNFGGPHCVCADCPVPLRAPKPAKVWWPCSWEWKSFLPPWGSRPFECSNGIQLFFARCI